jgi:hypothetical protein
MSSLTSFPFFAFAFPRFALSGPYTSRQIRIAKEARKVRMA